MFLSSRLTIVVSTLLATGSAGTVPLLARWDTSICTAATSGVPIPDADNFQLPLENLRQDMCWDLCLGDQAACTLKTKICYDFVGPNLIFDFKPITGYTYTEADIWLGLSAPTSSTPTSQYTTANGACVISADQSTVHCNIPYSSIVGGNTLLEQLAAMCPYGDREGYVWYLYTNAKLTSADCGEVSAEGRLSCTDYPACTSYLPNTFWELTYRCTKCPDVPPVAVPPTVNYCSVGTAFGYSTSPLSPALNSLVPKPKTCNRWGWYIKPTPAQLTAGVSGPLYIGAGGNVISRATNAGTWSANSVGTNVFVTYTLAGPYYLSEVHVDIGCLPFKTCAPGQYAFGNTALEGTGKTTFTTPTGALKVPSCGAAGIYIIVHAAIDTVETVVSTTSPCTPAIAA